MNEQLLAAAEWACQRQVLDRCVNTADRTETEHDFRLRFVSPFLDELKPVAAERGLDPAWVYGLIRQESRFVMDARSWAGAQGLMQIMPSTARWIARKLGERDFRVEQLHDLPTNLRFRHHYLRSVLDDLEGSPVRVGRVQRGPRAAAQLALDAAAARRGCDLRRDHPVQRDPRLREEGAVERRLLRGAVLGRTAIVEGATRQRRAAAGLAQRPSLSARRHGPRARAPRRRHRLHRKPDRRPARGGQPPRAGPHPALRASAAPAATADGRGGRSRRA